MAAFTRRRKVDNSFPKDSNQEKTSCKSEDKIVCGDAKTLGTGTRFQQLFGFSLADLSSWKNFVELMYRPMDPASLGVIRALFGLTMVLDIPDERGLSVLDVYWGDPRTCHFPLFNFLHPLPLEWMFLVYFIMWCGAFGIMLGLFFQLSCVAFLIPYWYVLLLEKSVWNNHSYLYGLVALLLLGSCANYAWSLDVYFGRIKPNTHVPLWNYAILRFQFFLLYFYAGLKKLNKEWLGGYSMLETNTHWVFEPFKLVLTPEQVDYWIIHFCGFLLDLTVGFWLFFDKTRPYAFFFCSSFHLMNSRIFSIGMFSYVCLVTLPIFSHADWPRKLTAKISKKENDYPQFVQNESCVYRTNVSSLAQDSGQELKREKTKADSSVKSKLTCRNHLVVILLLTHVGLQAFLPYSHFITKGYNNWTNGMYGYSWDMMVFTWHTSRTAIRVVDNKSGKEHFLDPEAWVHSDRWSRHADMVVQYVHCLKRNLMDELRTGDENIRDYITSENISIYVDVMASFNHRFLQRMFDPRMDILKADWSPFEKVPWLMPLLVEYGSWRENLRLLEKEVYSWSNHSDVLFIADFPGLTFENFVNTNLTNVTLTVLEGEVVLEKEPSGRKRTKLLNQTLGVGQSVKVTVGEFHKLHVISPVPSCYMYTYINETSLLLEEKSSNSEDESDSMKDEVQGLFSEITFHIEQMFNSIRLIVSAVYSLLRSVPMARRVRIG